ncbi:hypothetical protein [Lewinella sp. W8]|uniref:hypothetical protein n=1 Tax=Lewinella sp. W8 TaxID=2528208 RepID=UPI001067E6A2|nr:hypothetical protein [Lewinella sp. W8]MTB49950.1 hypothetical protein [Lewinella sp. W8]
MNSSLKQFLSLCLPVLATLCLGAAMTSCEKEALIPVGTHDEVTELNSLEKSGRIIHRVSVGSPDACEALGQPQGCDANFSLIALMHADGTVKGQYHDQFSSGNGGVHVDVDCLIVDGNRAIIGGVIKKGPAEGPYQVGTRVVTSVWDNGTSANDDPDAISFTYSVPGSCDVYANAQFAVLPLTAGQVSIR